MQAIVSTGLIAALILYDIPAPAAATAVLLYHTIALWLPPTGGTLAFLRARRDLTPTNAKPALGPNSADTGYPQRDPNPRSPA